MKKFNNNVLNEVGELGEVMKSDLWNLDAAELHQLCILYMKHIDIDFNMDEQINKDILENIT